MNTKKLLKGIGFIGALILTIPLFSNSATILFPSGGGTGTSTPPTYGQILVGNSGGTYTLTATSTLGISGGGGGVGTSTNPFMATYFVATSTTATSSLPNITGQSLFLTKNSLGSTQNLSYGLKLENTTAAANGAQQISPALHFSGRGYNSGGAGSSQSIDFVKELLPVQGASGATGKLVTQISRNGAAYSTIHTQSTTGEIVQTVLSGVSAITGYELSGTFSNGTTDTTQHMKFSNAGSNTWLTFYFSGVQKGAYGVDSSGVMRFYTSGNRYLFHSGVTGSSLLAEIYSGGIYNNGGSFNAGRLTAGSAVTSPPATFTNYGSTALQTTVITTPTTLTDSYTQVIVDCSSYNICSGTPSVTDCTTYTGSGQATCEGHLPCTWYAGDSCSAFDNESGMGTCAGTSGCSVADTSCSGANNTDSTTCEAQDDTYGGSCSYDTSTCPSQTSTAACSAISGCTPNISTDCSYLSDGGGDGTNCATQPECSYDSGTGSCSGNHFTSCSGDLCGGTYYTGTCNGTYNISCSGTATCSPYGDSGSCAGETGCSWISGVDITMPASPIEKTYWIAKDYTSGTLRILPNSGQTINNTTSITSTSSGGVGWMLTWIESKSNWYIMSKH